jgi:hypothetical protein
MRTGEIEANLARLNELYPLSYVDALIERKQAGAEHEKLARDEIGFYGREFAALRDRLSDEAARTSLPEAPTAGAMLNDLLVRVRLKGLRS